jgi:hypothetical protein
MVFQSGDGIQSHPLRGIRAPRVVKRKHRELEPSYPSDTDVTRSASPPGHGILMEPRGYGQNRGSNLKMIMNHDGSAPPPSRGRGRWGPRTGSRGDHHPTPAARIVIKTRMNQVPDSSSPAPPGAGHPILHSNPDAPRRPRVQTAHQQAVERNRAQRVEYILDRRQRRLNTRRERQRHKEGAIFRAFRRAAAMVDPFDDSDDDRSWKDSAGKYANGTSLPGHGGLVSLDDEQDDFGEEVGAYASAIRRTSRRLDRWDAGVTGVVTEPRKAGRKGKAAAAAIEAADALEDAEDGGVNGDAMSEDEDELLPRDSSVGLEGEVEDGAVGDEEMEDLDRMLLGEDDEEEEDDEDDDE